METDVTIESKGEPARRVIIDTKYYKSSLAERTSGRDSFVSANLYQLYAYLRTQEHRGKMYREAEGMLLYPCVGKALHEKMMVQGHVIRICTLNLEQPWQDVEASLVSLARTALSEDGAQTTSA